MAIQIAKAYQASTIVTTASPRNMDLVTKLGATQVINYREENVFAVLKKENQKFDVIYDTISGGAAVWEGATSDGGILAPGCQFVTITGDSQGPLDMFELLTRGYQIATRNWQSITSFEGARYHQYTQPGGSTSGMAEIDRLVKAGHLKGVVDKTYPFEIRAVKDAFSYLMQGHAQGKVVVELTTSTVSISKS